MRNICKDHWNSFVDVPKVMRIIGNFLLRAVLFASLSERCDHGGFSRTTEMHLAGLHIRSTFHFTTAELDS
jgi:hypothetical protein